MSKDGREDQYRQSTGRLVSLLLLDAVLAAFFWRFTLLGAIFGIWIGVLFGVSMLLLVARYFSERITIDGETVTLATGVFSQSMTEIPLAKVNAVTIKQGIFGRMLNFGTLVVYTGNDTSGIKFVGLDRPHEIKQKLKHIVPTPDQQTRTSTPLGAATPRNLVR